ncbi:MAG: glycosyltransferase [Muribaculaceae bacterium]|nr:glycosyltransferase [Muribaculaceae bacterium]
MKIALLSTNADLGGAAIVTRRLNDALRVLGEDARMIVARPGNTLPDDPAVIPVGRLEWAIPFLVERAELWLKGVSRHNLFKVSTGRYGVPLHDHPFILEADAVMINWASQGFLSLDSLAKILATGKPVIYTMHDLWPATALCHLPGECRRYCDGARCQPCPYFKGKRGRKLIPDTLARKREIFSSPALHLVAVSNWQREQALAGDLLSDKEITVIPHPFPVDLYQPADKVTPDGKRTVIMAAARLDDPVKDLPAAVDALNTFAWEYPDDARDVEVEFVGALRDDTELHRLRLPYRHHGLLTPVSLRDLYSHATAVISSSKYETMGATLMEGMAAGAIPVTYGDAGQRDIVTDGVNGFIAPVHTPASLAFALSMAMQTARAADPAFSPATLHADIAARFSPDAIARRYLSLLRQ